MADPEVRQFMAATIESLSQMQLEVQRLSAENRNLQSEAHRAAQEHRAELQRPAAEHQTFT